MSVDDEPDGDAAPALPPHGPPRAELALLAELVEGSPGHAMFHVGGDGRVATWNQGAQGLFGYTAPEIVGQPSGMLEAGSGEMPVRHGLLSVVGDGGRSGRERWWRHRDGSTFLAEQTRLPLARLGDPDVVVWMIRDLTDTHATPTRRREREEDGPPRGDGATAARPPGEIADAIGDLLGAIVDHVTPAAAHGGGLTLAPARDPGSSAGQEASPPPAKPGTGKVVLVVDDERGVRELTARMLEMAGYTVLRAAGAPEALDILRGLGGPLDLVLSDVRMPTSSGADLAQLVRHQRPGTPVVFMSGYDAGLLAPEEALLAKPFSLAALLGFVAGAITPASGATGRDAALPSG